MTHYLGHNETNFIKALEEEISLIRYSYYEYDTFYTHRVWAICKLISKDYCIECHLDLLLTMTTLLKAIEGCASAFVNNVEYGTNQIRHILGKYDFTEDELQLIVDGIFSIINNDIEYIAKSVETKILYDAIKVESLGLTHIATEFTKISHISSIIENVDDYKTRNIDENGNVITKSQHTPIMEYEIDCKPIIDTMFTEIGRSMASKRLSDMDEFFIKFKNELNISSTVNSYKDDRLVRDDVFIKFKNELNTDGTDASWEVRRDQYIDELDMYGKVKNRVVNMDRHMNLSTMFNKDLLNDDIRNKLKYMDITIDNVNSLLVDNKNLVDFTMVRRTVSKISRYFNDSSVNIIANDILTVNKYNLSDEFITRNMLIQDKDYIMLCRKIMDNNKITRINVIRFLTSPSYRNNLSKDEILYFYKTLNEQLCRYKYVDGFKSLFQQTFIEITNTVRDRGIIIGFNIPDIDIDQIIKEVDLHDECEKYM